MENKNNHAEFVKGHGFPTPNKTKEKNIFLAAISYVGPLIIISYLFSDNDSFVKFHIKQALVLIVADVLLWVLAKIVWPLWALFGIFHMIDWVLVIIGIVNAARGEEKELPFVGKFASHFSDYI